MTKVSKDKELYNKYQNTSYDVVRNEFDADKIIPQTLELIMSLPRNPGKTLEEVLVPLAGREFYDEAVVLEKQGKIVAYGIQEIMMKELHYLDDVSAKQILHMKVGKKSKVPKVPKIKEPKLSKKQLREELASDRLEIQELKRDILKNEKIIVENGGTPRLSEEFVASVEDNNLQYSSWERFDKTLPTVQNCTAFIGDEKWLVVVRKRWGLKKKQFDTMDDASYAGLILVIEGAGYYKYAKGMWKEFDDIFSTTSYKNGNYSQSVLPRKFEPYFNKM